MSLLRTIARFGERREHRLNLLDARGVLPAGTGDHKQAKHAVTLALAGNTSRTIRRQAAKIQRDNAAKVERFGVLTDKQAKVRDFLKAQQDDLLSADQREHLAKLSHSVRVLTPSGVQGLEGYLAKLEGELRAARAGVAA